MSVISAEPPLTQTPEALMELAITRLQEKYPNFNPNPADPQYELFLAFAYIAAETIILAFDVPEEIVRFVGEVVYQTQPEAAVASTVLTTWTAIDTLGHTLEAGTEIEVITESGERIGFETTAPYTIPVGSAITAAGGVTLRAIIAGTGGNVTGAFTTEFVEPIGWVKEVALLSQPAGGIDEETTEEYTQRIRELAQLVKPQPILPEDFGNFVRLLVPGLRGGRVLSLDLTEMEKPYGPNNTTVLGSATQRCVTVVPILENGTEPPESVQREAYELLVSRREASFKSFVGNPTYTTITVTGSGTVLPGYNKAGTELQLKTALEELLSPANYAAPPGERPGGWILKKVLRYQDVVAAVNNVPGFGHYTSLLVNGGTTDVVLSGMAPLTKPGTINIALAASTE